MKLSYLSLLILLALTLLFNLLSAHIATAATVITVPDDYGTIQAAINAAIDGDTIIVRAGTYNESLLLNKAITLTAEIYDQNNPAHNGSIIDGGGAAAVIEIPAGVSPMPILSGLVIRNGDDGISPRSPFVVEYCYFTDAVDLIDYEEGSGGITRHNLFFAATDDALDLDDQVNPLLIEHNRLLYSAQDGIEIRLQDGSAPAQLIDITIRHNEIIGSGEDGIQLIDYLGDPQDTNRRFFIHNNLLANNQMAGIGLMPGEETNEDYSGADIIEAIRVYNNTFYGNDYGISGGDNLVAFNNIIANTTTFGLSRVQGNPGDNSVVAETLFFNNGTDATDSLLGSGNLLGQDPLLVAPPSPGPDGQFGTLDDDFSGLILQAGSPAIDAGVTQFIAADGELIPSPPITIFNGLAPDLGWKESNPSNTAPVAVNDTYTTTKGAALSIAAPGVLGNDSDIDGDTLTAVLNTNVTSGTLTFKTDGSFIYTPTLAFVGQDTFTYFADDGLQISEVATVTIAVLNTAPVAVPDVYVTAKGIAVSVAAPGVLANDNDGDGDALTAVLDTNTISGTLTFNADGAFIYTPTLGFAGVDSFTYHANDGTADSNMVTVNIYIGVLPPVETYLPLLLK